MAKQITLDELAVATFITAASCTFVIASCIVVKSFLIIFRHFVGDLILNPWD